MEVTFQKNALHLASLVVDVLGGVIASPKTLQEKIVSFTWAIQINARLMTRSMLVILV